MTPAAPPPATERGRASATVLLRLDRFRWWIAIGIIALYLSGLNGQWHVGPDSATHVNIALNIVEGHGYTHPLGFHNAVSPGLAYLLAGCFAIFGTDNLLAPHLLMCALSFVALGLFYTTVRLRFDGPTALAATLMLAITARFHRYGFELMTDLPFLVGLLMFLLGYEAISSHRLRAAINIPLLIAGILVMAAFRSVVLVFFAALIPAIALRAMRGTDRKRSAIVAMLSITALLLARGLDPRTEHPAAPVADENIAMRSLARPIGTLERMVTRNLPRVFEEAAPEAFFGTELGPGINTILALAALLAGAALGRERILWGLLVAAFLGQMLVFPNVTPRYFLPILPLIALGWWLAAVRINRAVPGRRGDAIFIVMLALWALPNLAYIGKHIENQHNGVFLERWKRGAYRDFPAFGGEANRALPDNAIVLTDWDDDRREPLMYFVRRDILPARPGILRERFAAGKLAYYLYEGTDADKRRIRRIERAGWRVERAAIAFPRPGDTPLRLRPIIPLNDETPPGSARPAR